MYGLWLPIDIKGLSTKEIRIQLFHQICKSQLNLILYVFQIRSWFVHAYL